MQLSDIVSISLTITTPPNLQTGFGTGLILGSSARLSAGVPIQYFTGANAAAILAAMAAQGFLTTDPEYVAATAYLNQTPTPGSVGIGVRTSTVAQISTVTVLTETLSHVYTVNIFGQNASYTAVGGDTTTTVAAALVTAINALTPPQYQNVTAANSGAIITITANNAGIAFAISINDAKMSLVQTTPVNGIAQDLLTIVQYNTSTVNGNNWVMWSNTGENDIDIWVGDGFALTYGKIQLAKNDEANALTATDTLINALFTKGQSGMVGTAITYFSAANGYAQYGDAALMGLFVTQNPGSFSANLKTLTGITADAALTETQITNLKSKNCNFYSAVGIQPYFINGKMADGNGIDIYFGLYAFQVLTQIAVLTAMAGFPKTPFDDAGLAAIGQAILGVAATFAGPAYQFFAPDPANNNKPYQLTIPPASSFTAAQKQAGNATGFVFNGHLAGDALTASITGNVHY